MKITLYGKKRHAYTVAYKNFLKMAEIDFDYKDIEQDLEAQNHSKELYDGEIKYPILIVNDEIYKTPSSDTFNKVMKELKLRG